MSRAKFSLATLFLTITAFAVVLGLMLGDNPYASIFTFVGLTVFSIPFIGILLFYGDSSLRAFCTGAAVPMCASLVYSTGMANYLIYRFTTRGIPVTSLVEEEPHLAAIQRVFGAAFLASIALGYLCVWFRWLIESSRLPESTP